MNQTCRTDAPWGRLQARITTAFNILDTFDPKTNECTICDPDVNHVCEPCYVRNVMHDLDLCKNALTELVNAINKSQCSCCKYTIKTDLLAEQCQLVTELMTNLGLPSGVE